MENINSKFKIQNSKLVKWLALKSEAMKGFTLVELLVVIGVLGILAAGLLATIDPLEQFRKGADSNRKTTALELVNALTRYYATKNVMPWTASGGDANCAAAVGATPSQIAVSPTFDACIDALVVQGELKDTFKAQTAITTKLFLNGTATTTNVCYDPESKAESLRTGETIYNKDGTSQAGCPAAAVACYWCAR